jgi:hypothetical protein
MARSSLSALAEDLKMGRPASVLALLCCYRVFGMVMHAMNQRTMARLTGTLAAMGLVLASCAAPSRPPVGDAAIAQPPLPVTDYSGPTPEKWKAAAEGIPVLSVPSSPEQIETEKNRAAKQVQIAKAIRRQCEYEALVIARRDERIVEHVALYGRALRLCMAAQGM